MNNYLNIKLPRYIAVDLVFLPLFHTKIMSTDNGVENRYALSHYRKQYYLEDCNISFQQLEEFSLFFSQCKGRQYAFRMTDYFDYRLSNEILANGNNVKCIFNVTKSYCNNTYRRNIKNLVDGSEIIKIDNNVIHPKIDYKNAKIELAKPLEIGQQLSISVEYESICRFDQDSFFYQYNDNGTVSLDKVKLIEVL